MIEFYYQVIVTIQFIPILFGNPGQFGTEYLTLEQRYAKMLLFCNGFLDVYINLHYA